MNRKPDVVLVLAAVFALGLLLTLMLPLAANESVADPASALEAGVLLTEQPVPVPDITVVPQP